MSFGPAQYLILFIVVAGLIVVNVFYLKNLQDTLKEVGQERRKVAPSNVWLMFIPLFNLVYPFLLYPQICDSVKAEYEHRGLSPDGSFGRGLGIAMPILTLVSILLGSLASIASLVLLIIFWSKTAGYKNQLRNSRDGSDPFTEGRSSDLLDN